MTVLTKEACREIIARRVAKELKSGDVITLGIGLPTEVAYYIPTDIEVFLQSENGMIGGGARDFNAFENARITNAGGLPVTTREGAVFFDTAMSFTIIRGGHVDVTVLGALQVDSHGNLANWMIPGAFVPGMGGAMDLTVGAKKVIIAMEHTTSKGEARIVKDCNIPLTAEHEVDMIITERAVIEVAPQGLILKEINKAFTLEEVISSTEAELIVAPADIKYFG
ncbi:MAG: 3-oxoacid CoA-transferase subunit B [Alphaproteobacteria bacterium]|nr:3-oxoacid CoA-transferase subunit B [Alphaproteobacteria bacterium]